MIIKKCINKFSFVAIMFSVACIFVGCSAAHNDAGSSSSTEAEASSAAAVQLSNANDAAFDVEISAAMIGEEGRPAFEVKTNLPDATELILSLEGEGYTADTKVVIEDGEATSEAFSDGGESLSGDYILVISMSIPRLQAESVQDIIGPSGENMTGQYVEKAIIDDSNIVRAEFPFTIAASESSIEPETPENNQEGEDEVDPEPEETLAQKNAVAKAKDYLAFTAFSYSGLIEQLEYEGFTTEEATYGADKCGADWNEQAVKKAQEYLDFMSFSHSGLVEQLVFEGFTSEQAEYGVSAVGL